MPKRNDDKEKAFRIRSLYIKGFKAIDEVLISFPLPEIHGDPDVIVLGSRNGAGKTSVLEGIALVMGSIFLKKKLEYSFKMLERSGVLNFAELFIRTGYSKATLRSEFQTGASLGALTLEIHKNGEMIRKFEGDEANHFLKPSIPRNRMDYNDDEFHEYEEFCPRLIGFSPEPLIMAPLLFFHSYRKITEGNPELGDVITPKESTSSRRYHPVAYRKETGINQFKLEILNLLMSRGGLFEGMDDSDADGKLSMLNSLMEEYAGGTVAKLRSFPDNRIEFRIKPKSSELTFSFDGLSSGQKEVISTLYLVWKNTKKKPGVVLIDEPELHLNPEWSSTVLYKLNQLGPNNQYIVATHSEDVFGSVRKDRRMLLSKE